MKEFQPWCHSCLKVQQGCLIVVLADLIYGIISSGILTLSGWKMNFWNPLQSHSIIACATVLDLLLLLRTKDISSNKYGWHLFKHRSSVLGTYLNTTLILTFCNCLKMTNNLSTSDIEVSIYHIPIKLSQVKIWKQLCGFLETNRNGWITTSKLKVCDLHGGIYSEGAITDDLIE